MQRKQERVNTNDGAYQIYALIDPRDELVRYVGVSVDAQIRYHGYLRGHNTTEQQRHWFTELSQIGVTPLLIILETIQAGDDAHVVASERELFWIHEMLRSGNPLLNVSGIERAYIPISLSKGGRPYKSESIEPSIMSHTQDESEKMLTVQQVAGEMNVDEKTVRRWINRGELIAVNIGRKRPEYRISRASLNLFKKQRETGHQSTQEFEPPEM